MSKSRITMELTTYRCSLRILVVVIFCSIPKVWGHGYLVEPPQRSSLWRHGFGGPENYDDNGLNCGGFERQWNQNGGKCGICGDAYDLPPPRPNEDGGTFGKGIIIRTYRSGDVIDAVVNLTSNHLGWIEFRLCPHGNDNPYVTQHCLDTNLLQILHSDKGSKRTKRFYVGREKLLNLKVKLPYDLHCKKCVLQWKYNAGNSWGCDKSGCGLGVGPQEQFYNCADISILRPVTIIQRDSSEESKEDSKNSDNKRSREDENDSSDDDNVIAKYDIKGGRGNYINAVTEKTKHVHCRPTQRWRTVPGMVMWCFQNCPKCPKSHCICK
ncbi:uncharacterized protein LOC125651480 isoform X2 [Ostrea edulis]|uniref:uncharacterized protein LOC125651480 isoform X2 n=1 Tax=Ostrea edulis TaxID=37623 RepID=UPI0020962FC5|nr:uncharacterized protein LOC125651480 isoform X2 [Ostrea edulis]